MSSIIASSVSFVLQPIKAACLMGSAAWISKDKPLNKILVTSQKLPSEQQVSDKVKDEIYSFLKEINIDSTSIGLVRKPLYTPCLAQRSIRFEGFAEIQLDPQLIEAIEKNFTDEHKFLLAREVYQIHSDNTSKVRKVGFANGVGLAAYAVTSAAFHVLFPVGAITTHLAACTAGKLSALLFGHAVVRQQHLHADQFAANKSPQLAAGGQMHMYELKIKNLAKLLKYSELNATPNDKGCKKIYFKLMQLISKYSITDKGDDYLDFSSPPLSRRSQAIDAIAATH